MEKIINSKARILVLLVLQCVCSGATIELPPPTEESIITGSASYRENAKCKYYEETNEFKISESYEITDCSFSSIIPFYYYYRSNLKNITIADGIISICLNLMEVLKNIIEV